MGDDITQELKDHDLLISLNVKLDNLILRFDAMKIDERLRNMETKSASYDTTLESLKNDVEGLKKTSGAWNIINSVGVALAALIAYFKP